jgi:hypothetical protein
MAVPFVYKSDENLSFRPAKVAWGRRILVWCSADLVDGAVNTPPEALGCSSSSRPALVARERMMIAYSYRCVSVGSGSLRFYVSP